jgi:glycosyltransferase involved in cell wall biosynthesis
MKRICHATTVHPRIDARILVKELRSLAQAFPDVHIALYVQDGLGDETDSSGAKIVDTGVRDRSRVRRMLFGSWRMYRALRAAQADIVHFHDPELIPIGILLRLRGVHVIYDIHENLPDQLQSKAYVSKYLRTPLAMLMRVTEATAGLIFSGIVAAGPVIAKRFPSHKTVIVRNYPLLEEFINSAVQRDSDDGQCRLAYVGGIAKTRGIDEMLAALDQVKASEVRLQLAGIFQPDTLLAECRATSGWSRVDFKGWLARAEIAHLLGTSHAGLVVLHPTPAYVVSLPVKMFEYMAAGLPVIASDFSYWRNLLAGHDCVLFVDPADPQAIAGAIDWIAKNPKSAKKMGAQGQIAAQTTFNWQSESEVLIAFYKSRFGLG